MGITRTDVARKLLITCSAASLLALGASMTSAQQEKGEGDNKSGAQQTPGAKVQPAPAERKSAPPAAKSEKAPGRSSERSNNSKKSSNGEMNSKRERSKQASEPDRKGQTQEKRATKSDDSQTRTKRPSTAETDKANRRDDGGKSGSTSDRKAAERQTNQPAGKSQAQPKDGATVPPANKNAEQQRAPQTPQSKTGDAGAAGNAVRPVRLDDTQRTEFRRAIFAQPNVRRLNRQSFTVSIGTRIPRSVELLLIPAALVAVVPAYRTYRYVVVEDRICIVEPNSYEIVEVIDDTGAGPALGKRDQVARLELNVDQRRSVAALVRSGAQRADIRISLALGAEIPAGVMMFEFPADIVAGISSLRDYRYVLVEDKVVIADPATRVIVLVVDA